MKPRGIKIDQYIAACWLQQLAHAHQHTGRIQVVLKGIDGENAVKSTSYLIAFARMVKPSVNPGFFGPLPRPVYQKLAVLESRRLNAATRALCNIRPVAAAIVEYSLTFESVPDIRTEAVSKRKQGLMLTPAVGNQFAELIPLGTGGIAETPQ